MVETMIPAEKRRRTIGTIHLFIYYTGEKNSSFFVHLSTQSRMEKNPSQPNARPPNIAA